MLLPIAGKKGKEVAAKPTVRPSGIDFWPARQPPACGPFAGRETPSASVNGRRRRRKRCRPRGPISQRQMSLKGSGDIAV
jgi:hypothetical protein